MKELYVKNGEDGQRLNKYLMKFLDNAPSSFIYKMIRKKNIVLNDKKATGNEIVVVGDSIKLYLSDDTIAQFQKSLKAKNDHIDNMNENKNTIKNDNITKNSAGDMQVIYQNQDFIAIHKPAGVLSQKADKNDYSVNDYLIEYYNQLDKDILFKPSISNRLDRNTTGIIMAGISLRGSQKLSELFKSRKVEKYYYTIVKGTFSKKKELTGYINKNSDKNISVVISDDEYRRLSDNDKKNYSKISNIFIPISSNERYSLIKIKLLTGKSHQIRAHLKYIGYPIIGDSKYGDNTVNRYMRDKYKLKYHLLHAGEISFEGIKITDELPEIFKKICISEGLKVNDN